MKSEPNIMQEKTYLQLFGKKLISFKKLPTGEIIGTGPLNPLIEKLGLLTMFLIQARFYTGYRQLGKWNGKRVANTFAPPIGSGPMYRLLINSLKSRIFRTKYPIAMTFAVTYKCQCNCVHCSAGKHYKEGIKELSTKEAKRLIKESQDLGISILAFTGGEPLLRKDIFDLIAYVDKKKTVPLLFTNGQFLTEENVEKLADAGLYSVFVSIDSSNAEEHDNFRNTPGLFDSAIEGIKRMKAKGIFAGISSYATKSGTKQKNYQKVYKLAYELDLDNLMLFDGVPTGNMLKDTSEMLTPSQREEIRKFSSIIFKNNIKPPLSSQAWQNSIEGYLGGIGCLAANIQYYVSAYGDVTPCDFTPLSFGNIRKKPLKKIWKRMIKHPAYNHRSTFCRMQNPKFRHFYIDPIPDNAILPFTIDHLPQVDYRNYTGF
ncbi:MAG: Antilisterial bacteriocin subtilosin biosynthesis protein AlbA [Promethearchaeota archaeon]|nr:MAG: Antilisterial bacteriocin subtilosin biosynthesis protein AlbA [Candidatus Lokiarchaeota archaeon]